MAGPVATTTTTTIKPCTDQYTSITLSAGESFVLPPGATVIGASDPGALTSVNDCLDLSNLETPECFGFTFLETNETNNDVGFDVVYLQGLSIDAVGYPFSSALAVDSGSFCNGCVPSALVNNFRNRVQALSIGVLFSNFNGYSDDWGGSNDKANVYTLCWKTIPSFGTNAYVYGYGTTQGGPNVPVSWPITRPPWSLPGCGCQNS